MPNQSGMVDHKDQLKPGDYMKYEQAVLEILKSLIIADKIPDYNRGTHTTNLIDQAFEIADEFSKKLNERLAQKTAAPK